uniref:DNA cytosine methyltransferase n=1 Tax=Stieleria sp. TaxID=2795976 RepID=UPI0035617122
MTLTFGSLFAGIGGIDLGFERAGMTCKWQVEIDDYARRVLAKHWPDVRRHDDVRTWPQPDTERVDVIAGGFPCQDISYAGKGAGLAGERSGLFFEL